MASNKIFIRRKAIVPLSAYDHSGAKVTEACGVSKKEIARILGVALRELEENVKRGDPRSIGIERFEEFLRNKLEGSAQDEYIRILAVMIFLSASSTSSPLTNVVLDKTDNKLSLYDITKTIAELEGFISNDTQVGS